MTLDVAQPGGLFDRCFYEGAAAAALVRIGLWLSGVKPVETVDKRYLPAGLAQQTCQCEQSHRPGPEVVSGKVVYPWVYQQGVRLGQKRFLLAGKLRSWEAGKLLKSESLFFVCRMSPNNLLIKQNQKLGNRPKLKIVMLTGICYPSVVSVIKKKFHRLGIRFIGCRSKFHWFCSFYWLKT
jgi:hypothetical protein